MKIRDGDFEATGHPVDVMNAYDRYLASLPRDGEDDNPSEEDQT